jgi:murein DD-endopeptidase MepM/ murein hydrolase activator NlpD
MLLFVLATPALAQDADVRTYTIVPGDTLFVIAQRFGVSLDDLVAVNGIADPDQLEVGRELLIPAAEPAAGLPAADLSLVRALPGDTLADVAARYDQTPDQLASANALDPAARLFPGQPLAVPRSAVQPGQIRFGAVRGVELPGQLVQGRTGRLVVETRRPTTLAAEWNGLPLTLLSVDGDPLRQFAYLPVPAMIAPSIYWLSVAYTATNGVMLQQTWPLPVVAGPYDSQEINLPPDRGALLDPTLIEAERVKVTAVWSQRTPQLIWTAPFTRPIAAEYPTTSPFGTRRSYNGGPYASYHEGQDFGVPPGVPVTAPGDGIVALAEPLTVRGNAVILDHGGGVFSGYWHLSEIKVTPGQQVAAGDVLGLVGNTGLSTGAHLHWELRIYSIAVDPVQFLVDPLSAPQS